jgi:hypothetical protein
MRLKYEGLYYRYSQKVDLLTALKQRQPGGGGGKELRDEACVLADFFAFLRAGGVSAAKKGGQVIIVAHSLDLLPFLRQKASPRDVAMIAGMFLRQQTTTDKGEGAIFASTKDGVNRMTSFHQHRSQFSQHVQRRQILSSFNWFLNDFISTVETLSES